MRQLQAVNSIMKQVSILITHQALIAAIGNTRYMLGMVNGFLEQAGKEKPFDLKLVGQSKQMRLNNGAFTIQTDALLKDVKRTDLVIIPPMSGDMETAVEQNNEYIPWIFQQYEQGAEIASLCVGAYLLAESGLLDGQECSTHWQTANNFAQRYPEVRLMDEKIITDNNGLYTSGGANTYWNLLVYLVEKFVNRATAIKVSKYFEVEIGRHSQLPFMIFNGIKSHHDEIVLQAQKYIENNYQQSLTIDQLAEQFHLGRRTFQRRFKDATNYSVGEYIQRVRVEAAKKEFEMNQKTINEVKYETGYHDSKAFRKVFEKYTGMSPAEYREKYSKRAVPI